MGDWVGEKGGRAVKAAKFPSASEQPLSISWRASQSIPGAGPWGAAEQGPRSSQGELPLLAGPSHRGLA